MPGTEIGRVTAKVRPTNAISQTKNQGGYVAVELDTWIRDTKKPKGVRLTTYDPDGKEIGSSYLIRASATMLEAALKAAIKEMK